MSTPGPDTPERIDLVTPRGRPWEPVVRLVLGGIADRLDLGFEDLDDLQLAVERLLAEASPEGQVSFSFELREGRVRTRVGPLRETPIADALQGPPPRAGELGLRTVLETVVDAFSVENAVDGTLVVVLDKVAQRS
jgi:anti-sigma regulatory factor (Ser/Thr protein kinase)